MSIAYSWGVQGPGSLVCAPEVDGQANVVTAVHWHLAGSDGVHEGSIYGVQPIGYDSGAGFTDYDALTPEIVMGWVRESMGPETVAAMEALVAEQISTKANPPVVTPPLPWG